MASLFYRLLRLGDGINNRDEDFLTEVFAEVLREETSRIGKVLANAGCGEEEWAQVSVSTQVSLEKIEGHSVDSRPDMVILNREQVIFFENKVASGAGHRQLLRYAEHLENLVGKGHAQQGVLVYLTREYDDQEPIVEAGMLNHVKFLQLRWHEVYHRLSKSKPSNLLKLFLQLMENMNLDNSNQFSPSDLIAMVNMPKTLRMMQGCLYESVAGEFDKAFGSRSTRSFNLGDFTNQNRYINSRKFGNNSYWIGYGFWLQDEDGLMKYPEARVVIELIPGSEKYQERVEYFRKKQNTQTENGLTWQGQDLADSTKWARIQLELPLNAVLASENHVETIEKFFKEGITSCQRVCELSAGLFAPTP